MYTQPYNPMKSILCSLLLLLLPGVLACTSLVAGSGPALHAAAAYGQSLFGVRQLTQFQRVFAEPQPGHPGRHRIVLPLPARLTVVSEG
jgi:hypothetical protein